MKPLFPGKSEIDQINRIFKVNLLLSLLALGVKLIYSNLI